MAFEHFYTCGEIKHKIRFKHPPFLNWKDNKMNLNVLSFRDCDFLWLKKLSANNDGKNYGTMRNLNTFRTNRVRSSPIFEIKMIIPFHDCLTASINGHVSKIYSSRVIAFFLVDRKK